MNDYRIYVVGIPGKSYPHNEIRVWATVKKTKKAIANKVHFPGPAKVGHEVSMRCPWVKDYGEVTLYWTGRIFIEGTEYEGKLANLQKQWQKKQAEIQAELTAKATVQDVLNFVRESRRNNVNRDVNSAINAGKGKYESKELIDRCDRGGEVK